GGSNSYTKRGYLARQDSGKRMLAQFDPPEPSNLPGSPSLSASRDPLGVNLSWTVPDSGAAPISSYTIQRAKNAEGFRNLVTAAPTAAKYDDATAIDAAA